jgi:hypothetical protein
VDIVPGSPNYEKFNNDQTAFEFMAEELIKGRLLIVLGAGVSIFYGMPDWNELLEEICDGDLSLAKEANQSNTLWADNIRRKKFGGDDVKFKNAVHSVLYGDEDAGLNTLLIHENKTLRAIGALCTQSSRGCVNSMVTFNYDCLVEQYFAFHGLDARPIWRENHLNENSDIAVYHPHGYLPHSELDDKASDTIVLARSHYEAAEDSLWQEKLKYLLSSHFVLFLGLSGEDDRLAKINRQIQKKHFHAEINGFWAYRVCADDDALSDDWEERGVFCKKVPDQKEGIPDILYQICQAAAKKRRRQGSR